MLDRSRYPQLRVLSLGSLGHFVVRDVDNPAAVVIGGETGSGKAIGLAANASGLANVRFVVAGYTRYSWLASLQACRLTQESPLGFTLGAGKGYCRYTDNEPLRFKMLKSGGVHLRRKPRR